MGAFLPRNYPSQFLSRGAIWCYGHSVPPESSSWQNETLGRSELRYPLYLYFKLTSLRSFSRPRESNTTPSIIEQFLPSTVNSIQHTNPFGYFAIFLIPITFRGRNAPIKSLRAIPWTLSRGREAPDPQRSTVLILTSEGRYQNRTLRRRNSNWRSGSIFRLPGYVDDRRVWRDASFYISPAV